MAKTRAQRKAERRRKEAQRAKQGQVVDQGEAQQRTQVPETADVIEAELAEQGADLEEFREAGGEAKPPAPSRADVGRPDAAPAAPSAAAEQAAEAEAEDKISRRARRRAERERREAAKESERRRQPKEAPVERQRGAVTGFLASCWAELRRVQWPDRETLIQASAITLVFIAIMAAYLGLLDAIFNWLIQRIL